MQPTPLGVLMAKLISEGFFFFFIKLLIPLCNGYSGRPTGPEGDACCCYCRRGRPPEWWRGRRTDQQPSLSDWQSPQTYQQLYPRFNTRTEELFSTFLVQEEAPGLQLHRRSSLQEATRHSPYPTDLPNRNTQYGGENCQVFLVWLVINSSLVLSKCTIYKQAFKLEI